MVAEIQELFPHISSTLISQDLQSTKSRQLTIERILNGSLRPAAGSINNTPSSSSATTATKVVQKQVPTLAYITEQERHDPGKKWEASSESRSLNLRQRKEFMMQQARKKFMEQEQI
jgi:coupling of ubiquitin conjugation to ER degradation protein 1